MLEKILKAINLNDAPISNYFEDDIYEMLSDAGIPAYIETGATKIVIIPEEGPDVVKIALDGENDDDTGEYSDFIGACSPNGWDYCEAEMIKYKQIVDAGLEALFLPLTVYGMFDNYHAMYVQPKATILMNIPDEERPPISPKSKKYSKRGKIDPSWLSAAIEYHGEDLINRFFDYINKEDLDIGQDLHEGNLGFCNGVPVILDYAGYWEV